MTDLEKFLRQASRGLWGRERQTIRRELESHVRHRASRYEISGSSEVEAIKLAIADLGEPREINSGMKGVYIMPTTIRAGVLTATLATFVFMGAQLSTAQVTGTMLYPTPACVIEKQANFKVGQDELPCDSGFSISLESLRSVLEPLNVAFENYGIPDSTTIRFPEGTAATFKGYSQMSWQDSAGNSDVLPIVSDYIEIGYFFTQLRATTLRIMVKGWNNPQITVGKTQFTLGSSTQVVEANYIYPSLLWSSIDTSFPGPATEPLNVYTEDQKFGWAQDAKLFQPTKQFRHTIYTTFEPGTVVTVLSRDPSVTYSWRGKTQQPGKFRSASVLQVGNDRKITYTSFSRTLAAVNANQVSRGIANGHATIAILRFTGEYTYKTNPLEPVAPATIKIISR